MTESQLQKKANQAALVWLRLAQLNPSLCFLFLQRRTFCQATLRGDMTKNEKYYMLLTYRTAEVQFQAPKHKTMKQKTAELFQQFLS